MEDKDFYISASFLRTALAREWRHCKGWGRIFLNGNLTEAEALEELVNG